MTKVELTPGLFTGNVIVQGITGGHGSFHALRMKEIGTPIVAGTSPSKPGSIVGDIPVYASIKDIQKDYKIDVSVIFVPAPFAKVAMLEAINADIKLIVCITENVPVHDMIIVSRIAKQKGSFIIGPNCPGYYLPGLTNVGIIPASFGTAGDTAIVSRSGTLTYELGAELSRAGIGQKYIIGIGGDQIHGLDFIDCIELFENDPDVKKIVMIGEIGGLAELKAADYIKQNVKKPTFGYITGHTAPFNTQLGHAGAIMGGESETASYKTKYLASAGVITANDITSLINKVKGL